MAKIRKPRVAAYARVSTGYKSQETSYDHQVGIYTERIMNNPEWEFVGVYADSETTGTTGNRPEFERMLRDAERHRIDIILCKSISRFARNTLLAIETIRHLSSIGVAIIFDSPKIDTSQPYSEMLLTIMAAFAQEESRNISERVKKGIYLRALNGQIAWTPLYGYRKVDGVPFVIEESEAAVVRRIYSEYEKGASAREIAEGLCKDGIKSPKGEAWTSNKVLLTINNERYVGDILTNKQYVKSHLDHKLVKNKGEVEQITLPNHHKGIIEREQYDRVMLIKEMRKANSYPFQDRLNCPCCKRKLTFIGDAIGPKRPVWACEADSFYIPTKLVEEAVLKAYEMLDASDAEDDTTRAVKEANPTFDKVEFWWLDDLVDSITFGKHEGDDDSTITIHWNCGKEMTLKSGVKSMRRLRVQRRRVEEKKKPARGAKKVRTIKAGTSGESST